jgi:hypothetical protein
MGKVRSFGAKVDHLFVAYDLGETSEGNVDHVRIQTVPKDTERGKYLAQQVAQMSQDLKVGDVESVFCSYVSDERLRYPVETEVLNGAITLCRDEIDLVARVLAVAYLGKTEYCQRPERLREEDCWRKK